MSGAHYFSQEWRPRDLRDCDLRREDDGPLPSDHDHSVYDPECWICEDRMMEARELSHELEKLYHADDEDYHAE
jgi:hypothetical protein